MMEVLIPHWRKQRQRRQDGHGTHEVSGEDVSPGIDADYTELESRNDSEPNADIDGRRRPSQRRGRDRWSE